MFYPQSTGDVDGIREEYRMHMHQWTLCRDFYFGIDSARKHIIKNASEYQEDFENRVKRAKLNNYVERIVNTMAGEIFRKNLTFEDTSPKEVEELLNTPATKINLNTFAKNLVETALIDGKSYLMVDAPIDGGDPYFTIVTREQIRNWKENMYKNFTMTIIHEWYEVEIGEFGVEYREQYRVLDEFGDVKIYRNYADDKENRQTTNTGWYIYQEIKTDFKSLPIFELDIGDVPPLYDIATVNASHLNFSSLQDDYLSEALTPMLFGKDLGLEGNGDADGQGKRPDVPKLVVGVRSMTLTDNPDADLKWVEMSGATYSISSEHLKKMEDDMAARALKVQNESVKNVTATATMEGSAEKNSRLTDIAADCEKVLNNAVNAYMEMKYRKEFKGKVIVNRDFNRSMMDSGAIAQLNTLQVSGNLSKETLLKALQKAELIDVEDIDEELRLIDEESVDMEEVNPPEDFNQ